MGIYSKRFHFEYMDTKIIKVGHPALREKATPIESFTQRKKYIQILCAALTKAMATRDDSAAIAAPQINQSVRVFAVAGKIIDGSVFEKIPKKSTTPDMFFFNPKIIWSSKKTRYMNEACLSVPGVEGKVRRSTGVIVEAYDLNGVKFRIKDSSFMSQIFQHEIDHLDGILFIDKAKAIKPISNHV